MELLTGDKLRMLLEIPSEECCLDIGSDESLNDREAVDLLKQICGLKSVTDFVRMFPGRQSQYLCKLHEQRCSIRQIARLTGVSKAQVERMLKQEEDKRTVSLSLKHRKDISSPDGRYVFLATGFL